MVLHSKEHVPTVIMTRQPPNPQTVNLLPLLFFMMLYTHFRIPIQ